MAEESYRTKNARKVNSKKNPDGYVYIIQLKGTNLFKIGASKNPKRRIRDINSVMPLDISVLYLGNFYDVYEIEKMIHDYLSDYRYRREWFKVTRSMIDKLIESLSYDYLKKNNLLTTP